MHRRTSETTISTGSSISPHGRMEKTSGTGVTRGASSAGTTRVACSLLPAAGTTSIVSRSSGMAT